MLSKDLFSFSTEPAAPGNCSLDNYSIRGAMAAYFSDVFVVPVTVRQLEFGRCPTVKQKEGERGRELRTAAIIERAIGITCRIIDGPACFLAVIRGFQRRETAARLMGLQPDALTGNGPCHTELLEGRQNDFTIRGKSGCFRWRSGEEAVLRVKLGDRIRIFCPDTRLDQRASHLKVFQVSEFSYGECMLETGKQQVVLCSGEEESGRPRSTIITVRPYSSTPNALTFTVGQYYWISTSNGRPEGIDRSMYGLCKTHQMRLKLDVSERLAERPNTGKALPIPEIKKLSAPEPSAETISVDEDQLKAVIELASQGKTGTYRHNAAIDQEVDNQKPWNPLEYNYYKNYYKQDVPLYEPVDEQPIKDYEIGEDINIGRPYPSYLSSSSISFISLSFLLTLIIL